jgi:hypothetical protein
VESDGLGLDFALLHIDLITTEDNRNVLANANQVTWTDSVSIGQVLPTAMTYGASWERSCT